MPDNVEKFFYIYEMDEAPLRGAIGQARKDLDDFVSFATKGFSTVIDKVMGAVDVMVAFSGKVIDTAKVIGGTVVRGSLELFSKALSSVGISIEEQTFLIKTAQEAIELFGGAFNMVVGAAGMFKNAVVKSVGGAIGAVAGIKKKLGKVGSRFLEFFTGAGDPDEKKKKDTWGKIFKEKGLVGFVKSLREGANKSFQLENRISGVASTLGTIAKIGGFAVILGPLLPLIKPFMKLVEVLTSTLEPAINVIAGTLQAAFSPIAAVLEEVAYKLMPILLRVMEPIVNIVVDLVENFATMLEDMDFGDLFSLFDGFAETVGEIAKSFVKDFLKPVGGNLFKTVIKMFSSLVKFAVEFVQAIAPYLPKFFDVLAKIADVVINVIGDAFDTLLAGLVDVLRSPDFMKLLQALLDMFVQLVPVITELLPPLTKLIAEVLAKFLVPGMIAILTEAAKLMGDFLYAAEPAVEYVKDILNALVEWWQRNDTIWEDTMAAIKDIGAYIGEQFTKFWDMMKAGAESVKKLFYQVVDAIDSVIKRMGEMFTQALEGAKNIPVLGSLVKLVGAQHGEHVTEPAVRVVGESGPEWIVPDSPEGVMRYLPRMMRTVSRGGEETAAAAVAGAQAGTGAIRMDRPTSPERLLQDIRDTLKSIELLLQTDDGALPEML